MASFLQPALHALGLSALISGSARAPVAAYTSLLIAFLLAYVPHAIRAYLVHTKLGAMKAAGAKVPGGYDVRNPRTVQALATDASPAGVKIAAMTGAHLNSLENYALIVAGVLGALQAGVARARVDAAALLYVYSRVAYLALYYVSENKALAGTRSLVWLVSICVPGYLLLAASSA